MRINQYRRCPFCAQSGANAIGFVFYENSSRCITLQNCRAIVQQLPLFVCKDIFWLTLLQALLSERVFGWI